MEQDKELQDLLNEHKEYEANLNGLKSEFMHVIAHKRTLVRALSGGDIHSFISPVVDKTEPVASTADETKFFVLNKPSFVHPSGFGKAKPLLANYVNYKACRIFYNTKDSTTGNKFEIFTISVMQKDNNFMVEIIDTENRVWNNFEMFMSEFTHLNIKYNLKTWLGL